MRRLAALTAVAAAAALLALPAGASAAVSDFSNPTPINGPGGGVAIGQTSLSPSPITVSGIAGTITDVNVFFTGVSAGNPDDIELLLQAPTGQTTVLWDDAGGTDDITNLDVSFNDESAAPIPDLGPVAAQGYEPSAYDIPGLEAHIDVDAPPPPHGLTLSLSDGTSPNGTWNLYSGDDANAATSMSISGGWALSITTTDPPVTPVTPIVNPAPNPIVNPTPVAKKCKKKKKKAGATAAAKKCKKKKKK